MNDQRILEDVLRTTHASLGSVSNGLDGCLQAVHRLNGVLRSDPTNPAGADLADLFSGIAAGLSDQLGVLTEIRARLAEYAPDVLA
jgi:hypothetical protein